MQDVPQDLLQEQWRNATRHPPRSDHETPTGVVWRLLFRIFSKLQVRLGKLAWRGEDHERRKLKPDIVNRLRKVITKPARSGFASFSLVYNSQLVYEDKHGKQSRALRIADKTDLGWSVKLIEPVLRDMWGRITFA